MSSIRVPLGKLCFCLFKMVSTAVFSSFFERPVVCFLPRKKDDTKTRCSSVCHCVFCQLYIAQCLRAYCIDMFLLF